MLLTLSSLTLFIKNRSQYFETTQFLIAVVGKGVFSEAVQAVLYFDNRVKVVLKIGGCRCETRSAAGSGS